MGCEKVEVCAPGPEARQRVEDTGAPRKWEVMSTGTFNFGWHNYKRSISARNPAEGPRQRGSYYFIEQKTDERESFIWCLWRACSIPGPVLDAGDGAHTHCTLLSCSYRHPAEQDRHQTTKAESHLCSCHEGHVCAALRAFWGGHLSGQGAISQGKVAEEVTRAAI